MAALSISNCCFDNGFVRISDWIKYAGDQKGCRRCEIVACCVKSFANSVRTSSWAW